VTHSPSPTLPTNGGRGMGENKLNNSWGMKKTRTHLTDPSTFLPHSNHPSNNEPILSSIYFYSGIISANTPYSTSEKEPDIYNYMVYLVKMAHEFIITSIILFNTYAYIDTISHVILFTNKIGDRKNK
jgi:hypothetical protein